MFEFVSNSFLRILCDILLTQGHVQFYVIHHSDFGSEHCKNSSSMLIE